MGNEEVPTNFVQEVRFSNVVSFDPPKIDIYLDDASNSVSKYSTSSANTASWASIVGKTYTNTPSTTTISNSGYRSIPTTSSISNSKDISETLSKLNETINTICKRLEKLEAAIATQDQAIASMRKLEAAIATQDQAIESMRKFEEATTSNIEKLADIIQKLEERTHYIEPRRLDYSFEPSESNKRRDTRSSPSKGMRK